MQAKLTGLGDPVGDVEIVVVATLVVVAVAVAVAVNVSVTLPASWFPLSCPSLFCAPAKRPMKVLMRRRTMTPAPPRNFSRLVRGRDGRKRAEKIDWSRCSWFSSRGADSAPFQLEVSEGKSSLTLVV